MKNKLPIYLFLIIFFSPLSAGNLNIQSSTISIDKDKKLSIFKNEVVAKDNKNNVLKTDYAEFNKDTKIFNTKGETLLETSEGYTFKGANLIFDGKKNVINSSDPAIITDLAGNNIYLNNFEYFSKRKFFKSIGNVKVTDSKDNTYNFSQIYIDEKKREIVGSDIKAFLNQDSFKLQPENKPRVFANTIKIDDKENEFTKSIFTICDYRKNDACPPWTIQASKMKHNKTKKTIYYDNAVIKVYDIPIFFIPKLSHPDPSVKRRSGFLPPTLTSSKNLGTGFKLPYFWAMDKDKDLTLTSSLFDSERPFNAWRISSAFAKSNIIMDFGYTEGFKKSEKSKKLGIDRIYLQNLLKIFKAKMTRTTVLS